MIYSRFGTKLTPLSKRQDEQGRISIHATAEGGEGVRVYGVAELNADDGLGEINDVVSRLPWHVAPIGAPSRGQRQRHNTR